MCWICSRQTNHYIIIMATIQDWKEFSGILFYIIFPLSIIIGAIVVAIAESLNYV